MEKKKLQKESYYTILGFLAPIMIDCIDQLEGTNQYRQGLKNKLKNILKDLEDINKEFFDRVNKIDKEDANHEKVSNLLEIYNATSLAYEYAVDLFIHTAPADLVMIMDLVKKFKELDLAKHKIQINPVQRELNE